MVVRLQDEGRSFVGSLSASKRWIAEIHGLLEKYPLLVVMRDNAGENKSKEISDFFTSIEVAN